MHNRAYTYTQIRGHMHTKTLKLYGIWERCCWCCRDKVSPIPGWLYSRGWPWTSGPLPTTSWALGVQASATTPGVGIRDLTHYFTHARQVLYQLTYVPNPRQVHISHNHQKSDREPTVTHSGTELRALLEKWLDMPETQRVGIHLKMHPVGIEELVALRDCNKHSSSHM